MMRIFLITFPSNWEKSRANWKQFSLKNENKNKKHNKTSKKQLSQPQTTFLFFNKKTEVI